MAEGKVIKQWHYKVKNLTLKWSGSGNIDIAPYKVKYIQIIEDYENNVFPIFRLHVAIEPSMYYKILKAKKEITVTLNMTRFYYLSNDSTRKESGHREYISDRFKLIMNDDTADLLNAQKQTNNSSDYKRSVRDDRNDLQQTDNTVEFYMFKADSVDASKEQVSNAVLTNCKSMTDPIAYLFSCNVAFKQRVLMAPPDDRPNGLPDPILVPPLSTLKAFLYLDTYYGIYKTGSMIYFGLEYVYVIPYSAKTCAAYVAGETQEIDIIVPSTADVKDITILGEKSSTDGKYSVYADYRSVDIQNMSIPNNYIKSNDAQVVDAFSGDTSFYSSGAEADSSGNFTRLLENKTENPFIGSTYTAQSSSDSIVVKVILNDIDARYITPNKKYKLIFEDPSFMGKYKGEYIITHAVHTFTNTGAATTLTTNTKSNDSDKEGLGLGAMDVSIELTLKKTSF